jgi:hypothetical protein
MVHSPGVAPLELSSRPAVKPASQPVTGERRAGRPAPIGGPHRQNAMPNLAACAAGGQQTRRDEATGPACPCRADTGATTPPSGSRRRIVLVTRPGPTSQCQPESGERRRCRVPSTSVWHCCFAWHGIGGNWELSSDESELGGVCYSLRVPGFSSRSTSPVLLYCTGRAAVRPSVRVRPVPAFVVASVKPGPLAPCQGEINFELTCLPHGGESCE